MSWNRAYRMRRDESSGKSRMFLTDDAAAWKHAVTLQAIDALNRSAWTPGRGQVVVEWYASLGDDTDADNLQKLVHDGLADAIKQRRDRRFDDRRFLPRFIEKRVNQEREGIVLRLWNVEE